MAALFNRAHKKALDTMAALDYSQALRDQSSYVLGRLADLGLGSELTAFAFDPVQGLLAVGTELGRVYVFGGPEVQLSWNMGRPIRIKHLAFRAGSGFLCCVDAQDTLSVYDLSRVENGQPVRDSTHKLRSPVTCVEPSASHSFMFLGGKDGTVEVYDIDRGCVAIEARIPNLWHTHEDIQRQSGIADAPHERHVPICTDIKTHPLDLNLLLIAYSGGVALWNIARRRTEKNWEFVIPPGAPGGGNDEESEIREERRLGVTCLAWRPDGLMFAAGHEDGCLSFAFCSDEMAVTIRTIQRVDVHKTTEEDLFGWTAQGKIGERHSLGREPIFRLAWSGFPEESYLTLASYTWNAAPAATPPLSPAGSRLDPPSFDRTYFGGGTVLTILGGLLPSDPFGIHTFDFPPYVPPATKNAVSASGNIPAPLRQALKDSITPLAHNIYPTDSPPEDFLLLPRTSPHYGMAFDPSSILITTSINPALPVLPSSYASHGIEAWSFPPTAFHSPKPLRLPGPLNWSGIGTTTSIEIYSVPILSYRRLVHQFDRSNDLAALLPLGGGKARPSMRTNMPSARFSEDQVPRILVSSHVDLSVRFWDVSTQLLGGELTQEFGRELPHMRVEMGDILRVRNVGEASRMHKDRPWELEITKVGWSRETFELAVMFSTGDLVVHKFAYGEKREDVEFWSDGLSSMSLDPSSDDTWPSTPPASPAPTTKKKPLTIRRKSSAASAAAQHAVTLQDSHIDLSTIPSVRPWVDGFRPVAGFSLPLSPHNCIAVADIGFFAASSESSLLIFDMRGPEIVLLDTPTSPPLKGKGRTKHDSSPITSLKWSICAIGDDRDRNPRLIVVHASGLTRVFELSHVAGTWILAETIVAFSHDSVAGAFASFVVDRQGHEILASPANLQAALGSQANFSADDVKGAFNALWITVSATTIAAYYNIDGPRTAVFEESSAGFESAVLATRGGKQVVIACARDRTIRIFSLPNLTEIKKLMFDPALHTASGAVSIGPDGDFVQLLDPLNIRLYTLFDFGRPAFPPTVQLHRPEIVTPVQQISFGSVKSVVASFFGGSRVYKPAEIEAILGGPDRPRALRRASLSTASSLPPATRPPPRAFLPARSMSYAQGNRSSEQSIAWTTEALQDRGERLDSLQERLGGAARKASDFAADAKMMARRESERTANTGFGTFFKTGL